MTQIVKWRVTGIEAGPVWDAIYGVETQDRDQGLLPVFVDARESRILADGNDATFVELEVQAGEGTPQVLLYGQLTPTGAIPSAPIEWVRVTVRWSVVSASGGEATFELAIGPYDGPDPESASRTAEAIMGHQFLNGNATGSTPADGILEQVFEFTAAPTDYLEMTPQPGMFGYFLDFYGGDALGMLQAGAGPVWLQWLQTEPATSADPVQVISRFHDILVEVAHEGGAPLPLRQVPRDDVLAFGGVIRAPGGTSVQSSIRQAGGSYW